MALQQNIMTILYCPSIQEHSSLCVSRQSKSSRTVHVTSIQCRSSNTPFIHLGSATHLRSQSGSKWKSFEMLYQILEVPSQDSLVQKKRRNSEHLINRPVDEVLAFNARKSPLFAEAGLLEYIRM